MSTINAATNDDDNAILFAKQAIFDKALKIHAYELLYRPSYGSTVSGFGKTSHPHQNSIIANKILNALAHTDFSQLSSSYRLFINFNKDCIIKNLHLSLPKDYLVIEILEHVDLDEEVSHAIKKMHEQGYKIALDDFIYNDFVKPLLPSIDYIKLDIKAMSRNELLKQLDLLKDYQGKLIAEKIETHKEYSWCLEKGFDYFQGYFFAKPENVLRG